MRDYYRATKTLRQLHQRLSDPQPGRRLRADVDAIESVAGIMDEASADGLALPVLHDRRLFWMMADALMEASHADLPPSVRERSRRYTAPATPHVDDPTRAAMVDELHDLATWAWSRVHVDRLVRAKREEEQYSIDQRDIMRRRARPTGDSIVLRFGAGQEAGAGI